MVSVGRRHGTEVFSAGHVPGMFVSEGWRRVQDGGEEEVRSEV